MANVYGCIFLRKSFRVDRLDEIARLRLSALVDDGFVAWINGTEVLRVGVQGEPGSALTISTLADNAVEPVSMTEYDLPPPASYLIPGTNVLAVQVFQSSLGSSDLGFEATLESIVNDPTPPVVLRVIPEPASSVETLTELSVTFSEPVTGVVAGHLRVRGVGATSVERLDASTFRYSFPQPAYGNVEVSWSSSHTITDLAVNPNRLNEAGPFASWRYTLTDRTPPRILGLSPPAGARVRSLSSISVLFSEPVAGVDASDLRIGDVAASGVTAIAETEYVFSFPQPSPGIIAFAWSPAHGIRDQSPAVNPFVGEPWTVRLDPEAVEDPPYISEFMASNTRTLRDESLQYTDWIEIHNPAPAPVNLEGWFLTDTTNNLSKWRFPDAPIPAHGFLVVFASGQNRRVPGANLHTDFQLGAAGEFLALVRPDGRTATSSWSPTYPPQIPDISFGLAQVANGSAFEVGATNVYFTRPTPGVPNSGGNAVPGPRIESVLHSPATPAANEPLTVTARVTASFQPVATVSLRYRVMFGTETSVPLLDDGVHGDGAAGDGVFGTVLPGGIATAGQMIRYAVSATDIAGAASRWPLFTSPTATEEYLGTVVAPGAVTSKLPVFHLFVAPSQLAGIDSEGGGRASFFYDGGFYDNIYMELRGNTSAGLSKKSHRLEFNRGRELRHAGAGGRTRRSSLLAEYLDPSYLRQHLCFWFLEQIGNPAPFSYPVRVQLNGQFYQLAFHNDVIGAEQMERFGYDPRGALYKAVGNVRTDFASTGVFQKLEPDNNPSRADYLQLANGIRESAPLSTRKNTVFDLLDLPQVINHLAGARWCAENDDVWANMSLYRDTFGDGLWRNVPFDMNASWGQLYGGSNPLEATVDSSKSHPLYGGSSTEGNFNRLYDVIVQLPETRQMLLRRQRSILDQMVQPPETPVDDRILENHIRAMTNLIAPEAALDRAKWGSSPWAPGKTFSAGVGDLIQQFVVPRRRHWYATHSVTNRARPIGITSSSNAGIPLAQPGDAFLEFVEVEANPLSGIQAQEYLVLSNSLPYAVDATGWRLAGAVEFTFKPGTVIPSGTRLFVSPDVRQFRARATGPRGNQGLFVVGPYRGQLSARGELLKLVDGRDRTLREFTYPGAPSAAQSHLRVTEIMYHPRPLAGNLADADEFEYIELHNNSTTTALDLAGVRFVDGVQFDFTGSSITRLDPGAHVLIVANGVAFAARYGSGLPVAGTYSGRLDNGGERLRLVDAAGEEVLDFTYSDAWDPSTDGRGDSLDAVHLTAAPDDWNTRGQWQAGGVDGSPGRLRGSPPAPSGQPQIIVQPLSQSVIPGQEVTLSVVVTNTAHLPLGVQVLRNGEPASGNLAGVQIVQDHVAFLRLSGTDTSPPWNEYAFRVTNSAAPAGVVSATAILTFATDSDADGLSDAWESQYFGAAGTQALHDSDLDGFPDRHEFTAGTDPRNAGSRLALRVASGGTRPKLCFQTSPGRTYSVQYCDDLKVLAWRELFDVPATEGAVEVEIADPSPNPAPFRSYRVVTPRQP